MKFLFTFFLLLSVASFGFANKLPTPTLGKLPPSIPAASPIELIGQLSPQCQAALFSIVSQPEFFECVPVAGLLPLVTDPTLLPSVLQDPVKNAVKLLPFINAVCAVPKCSDKGVAFAQQAVQEGCGKDQGNPLIQLIEGVLTFYSPVRDIICFKNHDDELCLVETFTNILTLPTPPFKLFGGIIDKVAGAEPKVICTPCNKAIVNTIIDFFKEHPEALEILDAAFHIGEEELKIGELFFTLKCGFQFLDGKIPDSTQDPGKFTYQLDGDEKSSASRQQEAVFIMLSALLASGGFVLS